MKGVPASEKPQSQHVSSSDQPEEPKKSGRMAAHWSLVPSCCGITLKNGTLWLAEICTMVGVALVIMSAFAMDEMIQYRVDTTVVALHSLALILGVLQIITSLLLGYGAYKEIPKLLLPWIFFFSIQTAGLFLLFLLLAFYCIIHIIHNPVGICVFLLGTVYCHAFRYFILVVYSYYRQLLVCDTGSSNHVIQLA